MIFWILLLMIMIMILVIPFLIAVISMLRAVNNLFKEVHTMRSIRFLFCTFKEKLLLIAVVATLRAQSIKLFAPASESRPRLLHREYLLKMVMRMMLMTIIIMTMIMKMMMMTMTMMMMESRPRLPHRGNIFSKQK